MKFFQKLQIILPGLILGAFALQQTLYAANLPAAAPAGTRIQQGQNKVMFDSRLEGYTFSYSDDEHLIEYWLNMRGIINNGLISIRATLDQRYRMIPIYEGGFLIRNASGEIVVPLKIPTDGNTRLIKSDLVNNRVHLQYEDEMDGVPLRKSFIISIEGKTLKIQGRAEASPDPNVYYAGYDFGKTRYASTPRIFQLPTSPIPIISNANRFFVTTYVDPFLSTADRYEFVISALEENSVQATNTPAWITVNPGELAQPLEIVGYITASTELTDVLPAPVSAESPLERELRSRAVLDLHQLPMSRWPYEPVQMIRRWRAPEPGMVELMGTVSLAGEEMSGFEVHLRKSAPTSEHVLFSQMLDPVNKPTTGIEGKFPMLEGDELDFIVYGPASVSGGEVLMNIEFEHNDVLYSSVKDFSGEQGHRGWYYEQKVGDDPTLMVWKPEAGQWQSFYNRSYQNAAAIVNRSGEAGNAFENAQRFMDELDALGLNRRALILQGWSEAALPSPAENQEYDERMWGASDTLNRITQREVAAGNLVIQALNLNAQAVDSATFTRAEKSQNDTVAWNQIRQAAYDSISAAESKMQFNGVLLDLAEVSSSWDKSLDESTLPLQDRSLPIALSSILPVLRTGSNSRERAVLLKSDLISKPYVPLLASMVEGIFPPTFFNSGIPGVVDEDLRIGRYIAPRIGYSTDRDDKQNMRYPLFIDPRYYPMDYDLTSTVSFARVPYITDRIWSPQLTAKDVRRWFMERYALLTPVAQEYLDPLNQVVRITYINDEAERLTLSEALFQNEQDAFNRLEIRYANGLTIFANRTDEPWSIDLEEKPVSNVRIAENGYLAYNTNSGLISLIGHIIGKPFSVSIYKDFFFLYSRNGDFIRFRSYATDGMISIWQSAVPNRSNLAGIDTTEISMTAALTPLLRSNARISCGVRWNTAEECSLWILEAPETQPLLEFYDLPVEWFHPTQHIQIARVDPDGATLETEPKWRIVQSGGRSGIRILDIKTGDRFKVTVGAAF